MQQRAVVALALAHASSADPGPYARSDVAEAIEQMLEVK
jgi:hypothetical protein